MEFRWRADDGQTLNAGLYVVAPLFFGGFLGDSDQYCLKADNFMISPLDPGM